MFGLSWAQIGIIVLVGAFVLGPERIPTAVSFVTKNLQRVRSMAAGAQSDLRREIGPELDELRRQVADLRSLADCRACVTCRTCTRSGCCRKTCWVRTSRAGSPGFWA